MVNTNISIYKKLTYLKTDNPKKNPDPERSGLSINIKKENLYNYFSIATPLASNASSFFGSVIFATASADSCASSA